MVWLKITSVVLVTACLSVAASWGAWQYGTATSTAFAEEAAVYSDQFRRTAIESGVGAEDIPGDDTSQMGALGYDRFRAIAVNDAETVAVADLIRGHGGLPRAGITLIPPAVPEHDRTSLDVLPYIPAPQVRTNRRRQPIAAKNLDRAALATIEVEGYSRVAWMAVHSSRRCPVLDVMDALTGETVLVHEYCDR